MNEVDVYDQFAQTVAQAALPLTPHVPYAELTEAQQQIIADVCSRWIMAHPRDRREMLSAAVGVVSLLPVEDSVRGMPLIPLTIWNRLLVRYVAYVASRTE